MSYLIVVLYQAADGCHVSVGSISGKELRQMNDGVEEESSEKEAEFVENEDKEDGKEESEEEMEGDEKEKAMHEKEGKGTVSESEEAIKESDEESNQFTEKEEREGKSSIQEEHEKEQQPELKYDDDTYSNCTSLFADSLVPQASMRTGYSGSIFGEDEFNYGEVDSMPEVVDDETDGYEDINSLQGSISIRCDKDSDSSDDTGMESEKLVFEDQFSENPEESEVPQPRVDTEIPVTQGLVEEPIVLEDMLDSHDGSLAVTPPSPTQDEVHTPMDSFFESEDDLHSQSDSSASLASSDVELKEYVNRSPKPYRPHRSRSPPRNLESLYRHSRKVESEEPTPVAKEVPLIPASVLRRGMAKHGPHLEKVAKSVDDRILTHSLMKYMNVSNVPSSHPEPIEPKSICKPVTVESHLSERIPTEGTSPQTGEKEMEKSQVEGVLSTKDLFNDWSLERPETNPDEAPAVTRIQPRCFADSLQLNVLDEIPTPVLNFPTSKSTKSSPIAEKSNTPKVPKSGMKSTSKSISNPVPVPVKSVEPLHKPVFKPATQPTTAIKESKPMVTEVPSWINTLTVSQNSNKVISPPLQPKSEQYSKQKVYLSRPLLQSEQQAMNRLELNSNEVMEKLSHMIKTYNNQIRSTKDTLSVGKEISLL